MEFTKNASDFVFDIYKPVFKNIFNMYTDRRYDQTITLGGGRAGGKSHHVMDEMVFWLPEEEYDEAMVVTFNEKHKITSAELVEQKLFAHGYRGNYRKRTLPSRDIKFYYGNNNIITLMSVGSKDKATVIDKIKNIELENSKYKKNPLKFTLYEEFTAIISVFSDVETTLNALSSFNRHKSEKHIDFYNFNPPNNKNHPIFKWLEVMNDRLTLKPTIYDLPKEYQSKADLELAERLKVVNEKAWRHMYMGEQVGDDGLAFVIDQSIFTELAESYKSLHVQTDEATVNATTFSLLGITDNNELHFISNFYHSSKIDGKRYASHEYAEKYIDWLRTLGVHPDTEYTDGEAFAVTLRAFGRNQATAIHPIKDRVLGYKLISDLVIEGKFKIVNSEENYMLYAQMQNAEVEHVTTAGSSNYGKPMISKKGESSSDNDELHTHALDTVMYTCLMKQKLFLRSTIGGGTWR